MSECRFMHVGMTVSDLQQTEAFYTRYFGFKQTLDSCFKPEFFAAYESPVSYTHLTLPTTERV